MSRIYRRSTSAYYYGEYRDATGARCRVCLWTADAKVARTRLRSAELGEGLDEPGEPAEGVTLVTALDWVIESDLKPATQSMYRQKARNLCRLLGLHTLVTDLTRQQIRDYCDARLREIVVEELRDDDGKVTRPARTTSRSTVHKELITLRKALHECAARERPCPTPAELIPAFKAEYRPKERWLTPDEVARLLAELAPDRRPWVQIAVYYGCNYSELAGLRAHHIEAGWLHIPGTKRTSRDRRVPEAKELALERVAKMLPVRPWPNQRRDLAAACARAGIEPCSSNDLRRTFASWLVQAGVPLKTVARLMGHATTAMVDRVYGHLDDDTLQAAVAKLPKVQPKLKVVK